MVDKLNRGTKLAPFDNLVQENVKLGNTKLTARDIVSDPGGGPLADAFLLETGDKFLLESGDFFLLE